MSTRAAAPNPSPRSDPQPHGVYSGGGTSVVVSSLASVSPPVPLLAPPAPPVLSVLPPDVGDGSAPDTLVACTTEGSRLIDRTRARRIIRG